LQRTGGLISPFELAGLPRPPAAELSVRRKGGDALTIEALTGLLAVVAWPVVVLIAIVLLRRELAALFGRVREIEGPGSLKVSLDTTKVEQIIAEGRKENAPPSAIAERIVQAATILDRREARIMRALLDDDGRAMYNYQSDYYRPALESLLAKGYIQRVNKGFALTQEGRRVTREYIQGVLQRLDDLGPSNQRGTGES
jgi:hypothetical protein